MEIDANPVASRREPERVFRRRRRRLVVAAAVVILWKRHLTLVSECAREKIE